MPKRGARRSLTLLLAAVLALALAACTGDPDEPPSPPATTPTAATATATPTATATATPTAPPATRRRPHPPRRPRRRRLPPLADRDRDALANPDGHAHADAHRAATTFRYDSYDTTGEVAEPGSYAFLADPADTTSAVTTYEGLRDGTTTALRIHETDADGVSRAAFLDTVEVGDLFEWREADDCFVRYTVTEVCRTRPRRPRKLASSG